MACILPIGAFSHSLIDSTIRGRKGAMTNEQLSEEARKHVGEFQLSVDWMTAGNVSAALLCESGVVYTGICIDVACGIGFCAEHAAIAQMIKDRQTRILKMVAVTTEGRIIPPCGRCREFMLQINAANDATEVILEDGSTPTLGELLPHRWL
jgi:cytidine deaminase